MANQRNNEDYGNYNNNLRTDYLDGDIVDVNHEEVAIEKKDHVESQSLSKKQVVIAVLLCCSSFSVSVCFALAVPFFPEEAARRGATEWMTGFIFSAYELAAILSSAIYGKYSDHLGLKFMIVTGNVMLASSTMIFGLLDYCPKGLHFIVLCLVVRLFQGFAGSAAKTATFAVIANEFPGKVAFLVGVLESSGGLAFIIGPVIGGLLYQAGGFITPFLVLGIFQFLTGILCAIFLTSHTGKGNSVGGNYWKLLKIPQAWLSMFNILAVTISMSFFDLTLAPQLDLFHINAAEKGLMSAIGSVTYMIMGPVWGHVVDKLGYIRGVMAGGASLSALAFLLLGPSPLLYINSSLWQTGIALVFLGVGISGQVIPPFTHVLQLAKSNGMADDTATFGLVSGLINSFYPLGAFLGPSVGGFVVAAVGFAWSVTGLAAIDIIITSSLLLHVCQERLQNKRGICDDSQKLISQ